MLKKRPRLTSIRYQPIGVIHSPFKEPCGMPIQAAYAVGVSGTVVVEPDYEEGLHDLDGFSHIILLYHFHIGSGFELWVKPFLDDEARGVFATRAPRRPNAIGLSVVRLERIERTVLYVSDLDVVDGTPLLDIKPYVPQFDQRAGVRIGWLEGRAGDASSQRADARFR